MLAAMLLCLLAACSSTTFVYNRLDSILPWYLDDYVDLNNTQDRQLDEMLAPFLAWHRQQELPRYVALLEQVEADLDGPVSAAEVAGIYAGIEDAWLRLQDKSLDWLLALGASLSDEQVQEFLEELNERQEEYEEEYLERSELEYREDSYESLVDSMQDYLGRLNDAQRERLRAASLELRRSDSIWLQERAAWLQRLDVLMQRQPGWQQRVREAIALRDETVSEQYNATYEHNLEVIFSAIAAVLDSRSEKQDRRLRAELRDLREDLQTLMEQGRASAA
ncbi:MAG: hypothetical protein KDI04_01125 [Halieaceae bacterium]|nr:hypothetical protein [Halieaceae bacterium]MCP5147495.1 hypothetical protein [Pseudomonadales bacterium]MCP5166144.1 hypothetical protein [Pseudomonadales bacterium]MCP5187173.1 hypothetical protein [Pseudomonadales bacterium]